MAIPSFAIPAGLSHHFGGMAMNLEEALKYILTDSMDKFRIGRIRGGQTVFKLSLPSFLGKLFGAGQ